MRNILTYIYKSFKWIIDNFINKKYEYTKILISKIILVFIFFVLGLAILLLFNDSFLKILDNYEIVTDNMFFTNLINLISNNIFFYILLDLLKVNPSSKTAQLLAMLILSYISIITFIILSKDFNIFILPLIFTSSGLFMFYLKLTGNFLISSYTLINFYGIKIIKKLSDEEKLLYLKDIFSKYEDNLGSNFFIRDFSMDEENLELLNKFKDINDTDLIRSNFYQYLENFTQLKLTDSEIHFYISEAFKKLDNIQLNKVDAIALFNQMKENNLIGNKDVANYINNYINTNVNNLTLSDLTAIWVDWTLLNTYKVGIIAVSLMAAVVVVSFYALWQQPTNELADLVREETRIYLAWVAEKKLYQAIINRYNKGLKFRQEMERKLAEKDKVREELERQLAEKDKVREELERKLAEKEKVASLEYPTNDISDENKSVEELGEIAKKTNLEKFSFIEKLYDLVAKILKFLQSFF